MKKTAEEIYDDLRKRHKGVWSPKDTAVMAANIYADQFKPKWIPVEERLPPANLIVRAVRTYGNGRMEEVRTHWVERIECFDDFLTDIITHWQFIELPSAPERKEVAKWES